MKFLLPLLALIGFYGVSSLNYGVDLVDVASTSQFQCLRANGYTFAIPRAYNPGGQGYFEYNAVANIRNANAAGLNTGVYMAPQPFSNKDGWEQFDEMYNGLKANGIVILSSWLQVTEAARWSPNKQTNIDFINKIFFRQRIYGVRPGVFTSAADWNAITGGWTGYGNDVQLWYWNTRGWGQQAETSPAMTDFVPFAGWYAPAMKQYGQGEVLCGITIDKDSSQLQMPVMKAEVKGKGAQE